MYSHTHEQMKTSTSACLVFYSISIETVNFSVNQHRCKKGKKLCSLKSRFQMLSTICIYSKLNLLAISFTWFICILSLNLTYAFTVCILSNAAKTKKKSWCDHLLLGWDILTASQQQDETLRKCSDDKWPNNSACCSLDAALTFAAWAYLEAL